MGLHGAGEGSICGTALPLPVPGGPLLSTWVGLELPDPRAAGRGVGWYTLWDLPSSSHLCSKQG